MTGRLIVVSNRIPTEAEPSGGLVVALHDCLTAAGGVWIGTSGTPVTQPEPELRQIAQGAYTRMVFDISEAEHEGYYLGYANSVLWPLFHRRADLMHVQPDYADHYMAVNTRLADMLDDFAQPDDLLWIHDYHFLPLAALLRERGVTCRIGFFLHIPMPPSQVMSDVPEHESLQRSYYSYDLIGFQTSADN